MFGQSSILVAAIKLTALPRIFIDHSVSEVDYVHILFDEHEIVFAEGALAESLLLGAEAQKAPSLDALEEIWSLFPELRLEGKTIQPVRNIPENRKQVQLILRLRKNRKNVFEIVNT